MAAGEWELTFAPDTPRDVLAELDLFGHLIVTAGRIDARLSSPAEILKVSRYTGIVRRRGEFMRGGPGLAVWLGDEDGKGYLLGPSDHVDDDFETWFARLVPGPPTTPLTANAVTGSVPGTFTYSLPIGTTLRSQLDYVCSYFGAEWRVNPDGTVDGGLTVDLYGAGAVAVISRLSGGRDLGPLAGIRADVESVADAEDYTTDTIVDSGTASGTATLAPPTGYLDLAGNAVVLQRYIKDSNAAGNEDAAAEAALAETGLHSEITLSTDLYDVRGDVKVGANVLVYAPELGIFDVANRRYYGTEFIAPAQVRTVALSWSWREGMGAFYRRGDGTLLDIADYLIPEDQPSRIEVGSVPRTLLSGL